MTGLLVFFCPVCRLKVPSAALTIQGCRSSYHIQTTGLISQRSSTLDKTEIEPDMKKVIKTCHEISKCSNTKSIWFCPWNEKDIDK